MSNVRTIIAAVAAAIFVVVFAFFTFGSIGYNSSENWQIHQSVFGHTTVVNRPGYYLNWWGKVWTYPRYVEYHYTADADGEVGASADESIRVSFNDGGTAQVGVYVKMQTPIEQQQRLSFHELFSGDERNIRDAIEAHLVNCLKAAGPIMSSTENQASRKAEFNQIVEEMLSKGLYVLRRQMITLEDTIINNTPQPRNAEGISGQEAVQPADPIKVMATEIVVDPKTGEAKIASESPLKRYGMVVEQFSVLDTEYDPKTLEQFAAKKESFLLAEKAKAEQQRAVQEKLRIRAEGESNVEQIKQEGEKEKMKAMVTAEKEAEVAELSKKKAVTEAQQKVEVADQEQKEAETRKAIAAIEAETAEEKKKAEISLAEAKQQALEIGGALSEEQRLLATLKKERDIGVAEALSKIHTPGVVIAGSGHAGADGNSETALQSNLINLTLLKALGILDPADKVFVPRKASTTLPADPVATGE
jgi:regulator of protease activity HflC (stomatin/prohibitin superfamily)